MTGRTSKTPRGARRQSIISSVLQSIGKQLEKFQLQSVMARWNAVGQSCFETMRETLSEQPKNLRAMPDRSGILHRIILKADS